ncbi:MAG TPA: peptidase E, partial [Actinobacteria bacterium]|nr:peptidase E [Actinomycetota bacterium]
ALPAGLACDDGAGVHFIDDELAAVVTGLPGAGGYQIQPDGAGGFGEAALAARPLPGTDG